MLFYWLKFSLVLCAVISLNRDFNSEARDFKSEARVKETIKKGIGNQWHIDHCISNSDYYVINAILLYLSVTLFLKFS